MHRRRLIGMLIGSAAAGDDDLPPARERALLAAWVRRAGDSAGKGR
jgi:hypothetical protein